MQGLLLTSARIQSRCQPFKDIIEIQDPSKCNKRIYYAAELCNECIEQNAALVNYKDTVCRPDELDVEDALESVWRILASPNATG